MWQNYARIQEVHATEIFCRREKVGGGLWVEISMSGLAVIDRRDKRMDSQQKLGGLIA